MSIYSFDENQTRNRAIRAAAALLMGTALVGCMAPGAHPGVSRYEPTYLRLTEERVFAQALRRHYLELATNAFDRGDIARSDFYSLRALMAAEGKLAHPGQAANHIDLGGEAAAAGDRLALLLMSGARVGSPDVAARAQAAYDCWLVESGPDGSPQIAQSCRFNAMNAIAELEGASTGAQLAHAGGPRIAKGQTYVIEPGGPTQTIQAPGGYTIEIITEQRGYAPAPAVVAAPATYTTVEQAAVPYAVETIAAPRYIETTPLVAAPIIHAPEAASPYASYAAVETLPTVDLGPTVAFDEPIAVAAMQPMPVQSAYYDAAPLQTVPVFNMEPVETMPMVEMAPMAMMQSSDTASALMDAATSIEGDFAVFFGFDSDDVTLEGEDVLIDAVEQIRLSGASRITLMGFTDSIGDARYNQLLAMRRAQAVRKYLQSALGTEVSFEILPVGEAQAVRNGGDGVKEALNRKVEIGLR